MREEEVNDKAVEMKEINLSTYKNKRIEELAQTLPFGVRLFYDRAMGDLGITYFATIYGKGIKIPLTAPNEIVLIQDITSAINTLETPPARYVRHSRSKVCLRWGLKIDNHLLYVYKSLEDAERKARLFLGSNLSTKIAFIWGDEVK